MFGPTFPLKRESSRSADVTDLATYRFALNAKHVSITTWVTFLFLISESFTFKECPLV